MRTLLLCAAVSVIGFTAAGAQSIDDASAIPLSRTRTGLITVPVTVEGRTFTFLLDTGSARSVMSKAAAQEIKVSVYPGARIIGATGTKDVQQAWVEELRVGPVRLENHLVIVADLGVLGRYDIKVDGILGADVLTRGKLRLDFAQGRLWLLP